MSYENYAPPLSNANTKEVARAQYQGQVMGDKKICVGPVPSEDGLKRAPDKVACPNCGEFIPNIAAYHTTVNDELCIIDPLRTLRAGKISRAKFEELMQERSVNPEK